MVNAVCNRMQYSYIALSGSVFNKSAMDDKRQQTLNKAIIDIKGRMKKSYVSINGTATYNQLIQAANLHTYDHY